MPKQPRVQQRNPQPLKCKLSQFENHNHKQETWNEGCRRAKAKKRVFIHRDQIECEELDVVISKVLELGALIEEEPENASLIVSCSGAATFLSDAPVVTCSYVHQSYSSRRWLEAENFLCIPSSATHENPTILKKKISKNFGREEIVHLVNYMKENVSDFSKCPSYAMFKQYCVETNAPRRADSYQRKYQSLLRMNELSSFLNETQQVQNATSNNALEVQEASFPPIDNLPITVADKSHHEPGVQDQALLNASQQPPQVLSETIQQQPLSPSLLELKTSLTRCQLFEYMCEILNLPKIGSLPNINGAV